MLTFTDRCALAWHVLTAKPNNLERHASAELERINEDRDETVTLLGLVRLFNRDGHSGMGAMFAIARLQRLLRFMPLAPINDLPYDWVQVASHDGDVTFQHKRCPRIFKTEACAPTKDDPLMQRPTVFTDVDGGVNVYPDGCRTSRPVEVTFPYQVPNEPKRFMVDGEGNDLPSRMTLLLDELEDVVAPHDAAAQGILAEARGLAEVLERQS